MCGVDVYEATIVVLLEGQTTAGKLRKAGEGTEPVVHNVTVSSPRKLLANEVKESIRHLSNAPIR
jgi:hypothetical protein